MSRFDIFSLCSWTFKTTTTIFIISHRKYTNKYSIKEYSNIIYSYNKYINIIHSYIIYIYNIFPKVFWYHNNVLLSSMSGRTRKSTVSNSFPASLQCRQKRYQLDAILLPMGGSSWMVSVSFLLWYSRFPVFWYREKRHEEL